MSRLGWTDGGTVRVKMTGTGGLAAPSFPALARCTIVSTLYCQRVNVTMSPHDSFRSIYRHGFARVAACTTRCTLADPAMRLLD